jgi:spore maturation protein CgeB
MRILILDTYYPPFLDAHYRDRPELEHAPYAEQLAALMQRTFGTSDAYSHHLSRLGHDAVNVVPNCLPLQLQWAEENELGRAPRRARMTRGRLGSMARRYLARRVTLAQIARFEPDLLYLQDTTFPTVPELELFRRRGIRVVGQIASAPPRAARLRRYDLVVPSFPHFLDRFRRLGVACEYLPIAFDTRVLDRLRLQGVESGPRAPRLRAACFVGSLDRRTHARGTGLLERVAARTELDVWGYAAETLPATSPLRERYRGEAWGLDMYRVLAESLISVNRHIAAAEGHANNMRLYETTGVGSLLVTEAAPNLADLFEPGREVVTYESADDLVEKLLHYSAHEDEARAIATAGHARTLSEHTYEQRLAELSGLLSSRFG